MEFSYEVIAILFGVAALAGFIDAIAGGGGLLTVPALLSVGIPPAQALATNKLQSSFGSFSASLYFVRNGLVNLKTMRLAIACTFVGSAIGAELVQFIDAGVLTSIIPLLLLGISLYFLFAPQAGVGGGEAKLSETAFAFSVGFGIGFYDGFFGPGTGSLFTICFVAIAQLSMIEATARTKVLNFTSNIAALLFFIMAGLPVWEIGLTMAVGGFIGARFGAKVAITKGRKLIRPMVVVISMVMAIKLLLEQNPQWFQ
ncbi:TSUP family transporter [Photobacterium sanguinicancri]|uniref:Probable membrane transporter protein n=1 Tax=Photobacterium sanguinicancri TaxID=875932 RepID=A0AAW7Y2R2_9GAMM|nr:TSUP family transporter [Photobacterium sanguinicancri]MDO6541233.1 TSUP family transporter [Photobacterium sanguinicancri]